ncbi:hypothetical protein THAOC_34721, partial [Thalassiosira oceanica]
GRDRGGEGVVETRRRTLYANLWSSRHDGNCGGGYGHDDAAWNRSQREHHKVDDTAGGRTRGSQSQPGISQRISAFGDAVGAGPCIELSGHEWHSRRAQSVLATDGQGGAARVGHSSVLAPCKDGLQVLSWGGRVPGNQFTNDFQSLKTKLL